MLDFECPCVIPQVLKISGHGEKFTNLMVKDENTSLSGVKVSELKHVLALLHDFSPEELSAMIKLYGITASHTKNSLSDPYPFNLMFQTSIGPSGVSHGYMRPETAHGFFVNFKDLYYYNGNKLPFQLHRLVELSGMRSHITPPYVQVLKERRRNAI